MLENYNNEKHTIKAKFKHLLNTFCNLGEQSYSESDEVDLDKYFELLEE
jgi:hypothetical protein